MIDTAILGASQVAINLVTWPLVIGLVVSLIRRPHPWPRAIPVVATTVILVGTVLGQTFGEWPMISAGAWWLAFPVILATYPDGRFVPRWLLVPVAAYLAFAVAYFLTGSRIADDWGAIVGFSQLLLLGGSIYRYTRRSTTEERESVRWAILGTIVCVELYLLIMLVESGEVGAHGPVSLAAANLASSLIPIGFALGLLRPRLFDADRALRVVIVLTLAVPVLALVYGGTVALLDASYPEAAGWIGAVVVTAATIPFVGLSRRIADWVVFRGRQGETASVAALDRNLALLDDAGSVPSTIVRSITESLGLQGAELRGDPLLAASAGTVIAATAEFPISYQGQALSTLVVSPRRTESSLTSHDRAILHRLAVHAAPALHGARTVAELQQTHSVMLRAREEERRRLRRDLHDDLSPTLTGLGLAAAALARRARTEVPTLATTAEDLAHDIQAAVTQTRELAYGLRPPVLDEHGLVEAIRHRTHGQEADSLVISIYSDGVPRELPAAVDLAALRIVQESVENVRRHADATRCEIRLRIVSGDALFLTVSDDGVGFPSRLAAGLGLGSIRERARELGGTATFARSPWGGAEVTVTLPVIAASLNTAELPL